MALAMAREKGASLNCSSSNANVNVWTGVSLARCARLATALESMPPERKIPSGTSAIKWSLTLSWSTSRSSGAVTFVWVDGSGICQCRTVRLVTPCPSMTRTSPGRIISMPSTAVWGPATNPFHRTEDSARLSRCGRPSSPDARMPLSSEAKSKDHSPSGLGLRVI